MDPYAELGVPKNADQATIKKAYRRKSAKAHPDRGGSHEQQSALNRAWALLGDEKARARFDSGASMEPEVTLEQLAITLLCQAFQMGLEKCDVEADLIGWVRNGIIHQAMGLSSKRGEAQKDLSRSEKRLKKLTYRQKRTAHDFFGEVLRSRVAAARRAIEEVDRNKEVCELALKLVDDYSYSIETGGSAYRPMFTLSNLGTGAFG